LAGALRGNVRQRLPQLVAQHVHVLQPPQGALQRRELLDDGRPVGQGLLERLEQVAQPLGDDAGAVRWLQIRPCMNRRQVILQLGRPLPDSPLHQHPGGDRPTRFR